MATLLLLYIARTAWFFRWQYSVYSLAERLQYVVFATSLQHCSMGTKKALGMSFSVLNSLFPTPRRVIASRETPVYSRNKASEPFVHPAAAATSSQPPVSSVTRSPSLRDLFEKHYITRWCKPPNPRSTTTSCVFVRSNRFPISDISNVNLISSG